MEKKQVALDLINGKVTRNNFSKIYPFCNENIAGYFDFFDFEGKSLLTVGSSLDQSINAIYKGCKDITVLDICPFTEEYFYLKKAAILSLEPGDFAKLLFYKKYPHAFCYNPHALKLTKYPKLLEMLEKLNPDAYDFWLSLLASKSPQIIRNNLFSSDEENPKITKQLNLYLKDKNAYYQTREKIVDITPTFITADITKASLDTTYDNIILSNVTTYFTKEEILTLFSRLIQHLNPKGLLMFGYLYDTDEYMEYEKSWDAIYDTVTIQSIDSGIQIKSFQGVNGVLCKVPKIKDSIYVYQKTK